MGHRHEHRYGHRTVTVMNMLFPLIVALIVIQCPRQASSSRVYELTDKFLDMYHSLLPDSNGWIVKFYAPWCHYCRKLEPVYMKLAQKLDELELPIHVGRIDCTKFDTVSNTFNIRGFPTIKYVSQGKVVEFNGDRNLDELVDFAQRMAGPKIRTLNHCSQLVEVLKEKPSFIVYFGKEVPKDFIKNADSFHSNIWFFHSKDLCEGYKEGIYTIKGSANHVHAIKYEPKDSPKDADGIQEKLTQADETKEEAEENELTSFILKHRFASFVKITINNLGNLIKSNNVIIMVVVDEYEPNGKLFTQLDQLYKDVLESVALEYFDEDIIFGWTSNLDMINSLTLFNIKSLPSLLVINSSNLMYHLWTPPTTAEEANEVLEKDVPKNSEELTKEDIYNIIKLIKSNSLPFVGGNDLITRIKRKSFDGFNNLINMYQGNPILTLLIFGLPLTFLSFIIYSTCFGDIIDASEDDEDDDDTHGTSTDELHEKKD